MVCNAHSLKSHAWAPHPRRVLDFAVRVGNHECQPNSKPQHQPVHRLAATNSFVLAVQLLREAFRIAFIILIRVLVLHHLYDIGNAGPVKDL